LSGDIAHYYEGCVTEMSIVLDNSMMCYVRSMNMIEEKSIILSDYTYGKMLVKYPKGATWYSFSKKYIQNHIITINEIYPDLSKFDE
jgi:hypothetical protein